MDTRKIILASYLLTSMIAWFLTRSALTYLSLSIYQIRRLPAIGTIREVVPVIVALAVFGILFKHPRSTTVLEEVISELRKVTWPSREDVVKSTTVVIICIMIASFILAGFDLMWGELITFLLRG